MDIRPIRTEADYEAAIADIEQYFDNEPETGSPEADRFDVLADLISAYERKHWAIEAPDPVAAIREIMAMKKLRQGDLAELFGSKSRASEFLNRRRGLTMDQARLLNERWNVPAEILLAAG
ncbi:MAG TPA: XRE family transcriptional regulator [Stellaceae bacterium]|jgi:HTH-type transcriptional regulator/antitoxin HigA|nr:XRE family transcriptional regulator [Stellaceae bacterium]